PDSGSLFQTFLKGPWTALVSRPLEQRWSERTLREAQGRMQGQDFLVPFGATAKRNSPSRAKPALSRNSINDHESNLHDTPVKYHFHSTLSNVIGKSLTRLPVA